MARLVYNVMQDNVGNLLFDVTGTVRIAGTGTIATIYGDEAGTIPIANPLTNHPSFGSFKFYVGPGSYDFYMAKSGYTFETLTGLQGLGTMSAQNASAVAITGGTATLATAQVTTQLGVGSAPIGGTMQSLVFPASTYGLITRPLVGGTVYPVYLENSGGAGVGSITTTDTVTAYNTASDARLKHAIAALTGELDLLKLLRPVSFLWNADDSPGVGFIAAEVAAHVQGVITGDEDAVDEAGGIIPQMIDYSKLVPFLVGAVQTLAARLVVLEDALGV